MCGGLDKAVFLRNVVLVFLDVDQSSMDASVLVWFLSCVLQPSIPGLQRIPVGWRASPQAWSA